MRQTEWRGGWPDICVTGDPGPMNRELTVKALPIVGAWGVTSRWTPYLAPTLQTITRRTVAELALQLPVVQNLNGNALEQDFIFTLSLRLNY